LYVTDITLYPKHSNLDGDNSTREEIVSQSDESRATPFNFSVDLTEEML
jgi:hypothetical protein